MQEQTTWLKIDHEAIDTASIIAQIQHKAAQRRSQSGDGELPDKTPEQIAHELRHSMLGTLNPGQNMALTIRQRDCDVVPRNYVIDWRIPILGPIHALVRRIMNDEIRRFLFPSLQKQSRINRQLLQAVNSLIEENQRLRDELDGLKAAYSETDEA